MKRIKRSLLYAEYKPKLILQIVICPIKWITNKLIIAFIDAKAWKTAYLLDLKKELKFSTGRLLRFFIWFIFYNAYRLLI